MDITVLFTCHNRIDATRKCVNSLDDPGFNIRYVAVDDGSTDGTGEMLKGFARERQRELELIQGDGTLYWAGGMRLAMEHLQNQLKAGDYLLLVNDDVDFFGEVIKKMLAIARENKNCCIVGATCDESGAITHGGLLYDTKRFRTKRIDIDSDSLICDVADMNAFLIPYSIFKVMGAFDRHYSHSMADYDYCFELKRRGYKTLMTDFYVGLCKSNEVYGTWRDSDLSIYRRLCLKHSPKGLPFKEWFYYINKNFGLRQALWHSFTPYIRILIGD
ncbi:MAG: glycosyltransferase family 2 protein [Lachnospiraceae bacterium]|nr:glycosyltransferase family 2 protein [Lachnospiraceae bacterium]